MFKNLWNKVVNFFKPEPPIPTPAPKVKACGCTTGECPKCLTTPSSPIVAKKLEEADKATKKHELPATLGDLIKEETPTKYRVAEGEKPRPKRKPRAKKPVVMATPAPTPAPVEAPSPAPKKPRRRKPKVEK